MVSVFQYKVYQVRLGERLLNREACQNMQYAFSKPSLVNLISKDTNLVFYSLVNKLVHSLTHPFITEILLMGRKESNQTNKSLFKLL